jgi:hypothetical protein
MDMHTPIEELKDHGPEVMVTVALLAIGQIIGFGIGFLVGWHM